MIASARDSMLAVIICACFAAQASAVPITAGLALQYDGTDVTASAGEVLSWNNQGTVGTEGDVVPRLTTARPTLAASALNGHDVIQYHGRDQEVLRSVVFSSALPQDNMLFIVMEDNGTNSPVVFDGRVHAAGRNFFRPQSNNRFHLYAGLSTYEGSTATKDQYQIYTTLFDPTNPRVTTNGVLDPAVISPIGTHSLGSASIGNSDPNGSHDGLTLTGYIAEVLFYDTPPNEAGQLITENYLSSKYNIGGTVAGPDTTLGTADRYAGDLTANGDYDIDVFGIGRVDASNELLSGNSAGLQIDAIGSLLDDEWMLAGHKTADNGFMPVSLPISDPALRWERTWYLDDRASVGAELTFDFSDADLLVPDVARDFVLLYSSLPALDFSAVAGLTPTVAGDSVTFLLADGDISSGYYTLGFAVPEPSTCILGLIGLLGLASYRRRRTR